MRSLRVAIAWALLLCLPLGAAWACGDPPQPSTSPNVNDAALASPSDEAGNDASMVSIEAGTLAVDCSQYQALQDCTLKTTPAGNPDATGLDWNDPLDLQSALDLSACECDVWLAEGTYLPTRATQPDDLRTRSFQLQPDAHLLGGFAGTETTAEERDPEQHPTILSGDLGEPLLREDNAYHVVIGADGAELDGLTIRDGQADGFNDGQILGGGLFNVGAHMTLQRVHVTDNNAVTGAGIFNDAESSPTLYDCTIARNVADTGGGLYVGGASNARVERTRFTDNVAIFVGGAIAQGAGILEVSDSYFIGNRGDAGGAITLSGGTGQFARAWFEANWAGLFGGAVLVRDGASANLSSSVFFANHSVGHGGSVMVWTATLQLSGVTLVGNSAAFGGAMLIKDQSQVSVNDGLFWANSDVAREIFRMEGTGNALSIDNSLGQTPVDTNTADAGNATVDPLFLNLPTHTRFTEREGTPSELRVADSSDFSLGGHLELGDDGLLRTVTALDQQRVTFSPSLSVNTSRFLRIDSWSPDAPSLNVDLHLDAASPAIDRGSASAPELDFFGEARVDIPQVGSDCEDAACSPADLGGIETVQGP